MRSNFRGAFLGNKESARSSFAAPLLLKGRGEGGGYFNKVSAARPVAMPLGRFNHVMCSEARPSRNRYIRYCFEHDAARTTRLNPVHVTQNGTCESRVRRVKPSPKRTASSPLLIFLQICYKY